MEAGRDTSAHQGGITTLLPEPNNPSETDSLLGSTHADPAASEALEVNPDERKIQSTTKRLLLTAGPSILVCLLTVDFDLIFLSTNYSRRIASELHELDNAVWVVLLGSIMETASNPFYARVGDMLGRRRVALLAASLTMIGFLLCSLSSRLWQLTLSRLIVGSGCAGFPLLVAIILADIVPLRDFALWRSVIVCAQAVGDAAGGPVGSALADRLGWHAVFRLEFLVMAAGVALVFFTLHLPSEHDMEPQQRKDTATGNNGFDGLGTLLVFTTIALPLFALNTGGSILPWSHPVVLTLVACTPLAAAACYWSQTRRGVSPLIRAEIFQNRAVVVLMTCVFVLVYSFNALLYNLGLYIGARSFKHPSAFGDWALSCIVFARPFGAVLSGWAIKRYQAPWRMLQALVILYLGLYLPMAAGLVQLERPEYAPYLFLFGLSIGLAENCLIVSLLSTTRKKDRPSLLAVFNVIIALAGDIGVGLALFLTQAFIRSGLKTLLGHGPETEKIIQQAVKSLENIRVLDPDLQSKVIRIFVSSIEKVLVISCAAFLVGAVAVLSIRAEYQEDEDQGEESEDGEDGQ